MILKGIIRKQKKMSAGAAEALPAGGTAIKHVTVVGLMGQLMGYEAGKRPRWPFNRLADARCDVCAGPGTLQPPVVNTSLAQSSCPEPRQTMSFISCHQAPEFTELGAYYASRHCYNMNICIWIGNMFI